MASNMGGVLLLGGGALALLALQNKASASAPSSPTPTPAPTPKPKPPTPKPPSDDDDDDDDTEDWGGGGGSTPAPSDDDDDGMPAPIAPPQEGGDDDDDDEPEAPGEKELDKLDAEERAQAIAAAREAARQEAALEAKAKRDAEAKAQREAQAKALAVRVANDLKSKGAKYDRGLLKSFQTAAGIAADGLYGPETRGALLRYGMSAPMHLVDAGLMKQITPTPPTPNSSAAKAQSGNVTAPFVSMPAEKPSAPKPAAAPKPASSSGPSAAAKALAPSVGANLKAKGTAYDRKMLAAFQAAAGLAADGLYGPATRAALVACGVSAPAALFKAASSSAPKPAAAPAPKPTPAPAPAPAPKPAAAPAPKPVTVSPATSRVDLAAAKRMASDVAKHIRNKGKAYDRKQLSSFQQKAGLTADGLYGPLSVSALKHFGASAPPALFKGSLKEYTPPA